MNNKFKDKEIVRVNGFGKFNNTQYTNRIAKVICRDPFFLDYNIKFEDNTEDWVEEKYLIKEGAYIYENKLY